MPPLIRETTARILTTDSSRPAPAIFLICSNCRPRAAGAGNVVLMTLHEPRPDTPMHEQPALHVQAPIVVIGAGLSGLVAAYLRRHPSWSWPDANSQARRSVV